MVQQIQHVIITPVHLLEQVDVPAPGTSAVAGNLGRDGPRWFLLDGVLPPPEMAWVKRVGDCRLPNWRG